MARQSFFKAPKRAAESAEAAKSSPSVMLENRGIPWQTLIIFRASVNFSVHFEVLHHHQSQLFLKITKTLDST
jgi:hypothetical protein